MSTWKHRMIAVAVPLGMMLILALVRPPPAVTQGAAGRAPTPVEVANAPQPVTCCANAAVAGTVQGPGGAPGTTIRVNGRSASMFLVDGDGTNGFLNVGEDQIANTVALDFSYGTPHPIDPDLFLLVQGAGEIPNSAFTITPNPTSAHFASGHLAVTTPDSYFVNQCVLNLVTAEYVCEAGPPVTFDLTWVKNGIGTVREQLHRHETFGPFTTTFHGAYTSVTATVNGTWDGFTSAGMAGDLLDTQGRTGMREIRMHPNP